MPGFQDTATAYRMHRSVTKKKRKPSRRAMIPALAAGLYQFLEV
jgi:hypothetical protein